MLVVRVGGVNAPPDRVREEEARDLGGERERRGGGVHGRARHSVHGGAGGVLREGEGSGAAHLAEAGDAVAPHPAEDDAHAVRAEGARE